jgi:predicted nucleic acid-binding protein
MNAAVSAVAQETQFATYFLVTIVCAELHYGALPKN